MCGIGGYVDLKGKHPVPLEVMLMWASLCARGTDAWGAMWRHKGGAQVWSWKGAGSATNYAAATWRHIQSKGGAEWMAVHTRAATGGPASNNVNNHPVQYGNVLVTHNGVVSNKKEVMEQLEAEPHALVDTEAIAAALNYGGIKKVLELVEGSLSIAWVDVRQPGKLHLYTNGRSPLWVSVTPGEHLAYCSTAAHMPEALKGRKSGMLEDGMMLTVGNGAVVEEKVGMSKDTAYQTQYHKGRLYKPNLWYRCFDLKCGNTVKEHQHPFPNYTKGLHIAHGGHYGRQH